MKWLNRRDWPMLGVAALLLAGIVINFYSLKTYPIPHCDEAALANISYSYITTGRFELQTGQETYPSPWVARLATIMQGLFMSIFGANLFANRLFSWVGWLVLLGMAYLAGQKLHSQFVGLLAALSACAGMNIFWASHFGRRDIWVVAASLGLLYLWLVIRERRTAWHYALLGAVAVLTLELHPNAMWFGLPVGLFVLAENWRTGEGRRLIAACAGAAVITAAVLLAWHLLPDPRFAIAEATSGGSWAEHNSLWEGGPFERLLDQWDLISYGYLETFNRFSILFYACAGASLIVLAMRPKAAERWLVLAFVISFIAFTFGQGHRQIFYSVLWDGYYALAIGLAAVWLGEKFAEQGVKIPKEWAAVGILMPLIGLSLAAQAWLGWGARHKDFDAYTEQVFAYVPEGAVLLADTELWFAMPEQTFYRLRYGPGAAANPDYTKLNEAFMQDVRQWGVTHIIFDGTTSCRKESNVHDNTLGQYLAQTCTEVGRVEDRYFGADAVFGVENAQPTIIYTCAAPEEVAAP